jgi:hypothetical protein
MLAPQRGFWRMLEETSNVRPPASVQPQLCKPILIDPEVMGEFVEHGQCDFSPQLVLIGEVLQQGVAVKNDPVGQASVIEVPLGERSARVQAIEALVLWDAHGRQQVFGGPILYDDFDILQISSSASTTRCLKA